MGLPQYADDGLILTAIKEANQAGSLQPTMLLPYEADIKSVFDTQNIDALSKFGMTPEELGVPGWREQMIAKGRAPTQKLADALIGEGFHGPELRQRRERGRPQPCPLDLGRRRAGADNVHRRRGAAHTVSAASQAASSISAAAGGQGGQIALAILNSSSARSCICSSFQLS